MRRGHDRLRNEGCYTSIEGCPGFKGLRDQMREKRRRGRSRPLGGLASAYRRRFPRTGKDELDRSPELRFDVERPVETCDLEGPQDPPVLANEEEPAPARTEVRLRPQEGCERRRVDEHQTGEIDDGALARRAKCRQSLFELRRRVEVQLSVDGDHIALGRQLGSANSKIK